MSDLLQSLISGGIQPPNAIRISDAINKMIPVVPAAAPSAGTTVVNNYNVAPPTAQQVFQQPIQAQDGVVVAGDSRFSGGVAIDGPVNWAGMTVSPTPVSAVGQVGVSGGFLFFQPQVMAALNDYGLGKPQKVIMEVAPSKSAAVLTGVTVGASTEALTIPDAATVHLHGDTITYATTAVYGATTKTYSVLSTLSDIKVSTGTFSFPTSFKLDPDSCTITAGGTQTITYVSTVSLTKEPRTVVAEINFLASSTPSIFVGQTAAATLSGPSKNLATGVTAATSAQTFWSAQSATVLAVAMADP
jgi:hypothetical protein